MAYPDEHVESVAPRLAATDLGHLAVISREGEGLVGYLGWRDITKARVGFEAEEAQRTAFFGRQAGLGRASYR